MKGKTAIITGSTSGIGLGIAQALAAQGADILLNGFGGADEIAKLQREIASEHGVRVSYSGADLSKPSAVSAMVEQAVSELGGVNILINNAGIQHTALVQDFPVERWDAVIAINLSAVDLVVTELAVIAFPKGCATLMETAPGVTVEDVLAQTEARLSISEQIQILAAA